MATDNIHSIGVVNLVYGPKTIETEKTLLFEFNMLSPFLVYRTTTLKLTKGIWKGVPYLNEKLVMK